MPKIDIFLVLFMHCFQSLPQGLHALTFHLPCFGVQEHYASSMDFEVNLIRKEEM